MYHSSFLWFWMAFISVMMSAVTLRRSLTRDMERSSLFTRAASVRARSNPSRDEMSISCTRVLTTSSMRSPSTVLRTTRLQDTVPSSPSTAVLRLTRQYSAPDSLESMVIMSHPRTSPTSMCTSDRQQAPLTKTALWPPSLMSAGSMNDILGQSGRLSLQPVKDASLLKDSNDLAGTDEMMSSAENLDLAKFSSRPFASMAKFPVTGSMETLTSFS